MREPLQISLELARARDPDEVDLQPLRREDYVWYARGKSGSLDWGEVGRVLEAWRAAPADPARQAAVSELLRGLLEPMGWDELFEASADAQRELHVVVRCRAGELYALPWEMLRRRAAGSLLGNLPQVLFRYEWPDTRAVPGASPRRERVLFAWSAAGGGVPAADHLRALTQASGGSRRFDAKRDVIQHATLAALRDRLAEARAAGAPVTVLHVLCHGSERGGFYRLTLNDAAGDPDPVDAERLSQVLSPHLDTLRLVVLMACGSAGFEVGRSLGNIAQRLHRAGARAVVASRYPLSTQGSSAFAANFYPTLFARQGSLERAFIAARIALVAVPPGADWPSVQLYARDEPEPRRRAPWPIVAALLTLVVAGAAAVALPILCHQEPVSTTSTPAASTPVEAATNTAAPSGPATTPDMPAPIEAATSTAAATPDTSTTGSAAPPHVRATTLAPTSATSAPIEAATSTTAATPGPATTPAPETTLRCKTAVQAVRAATSDVKLARPCHFVVADSGRITYEDRRCAEELPAEVSLAGRLAEVCRGEIPATAAAPWTCDELHHWLSQASKDARSKLLGQCRERSGVFTLGLDYSAEGSTIEYRHEGCLEGTSLTTLGFPTSLPAGKAVERCPRRSLIAHNTGGGG